MPKKIAELTAITAADITDDSVIRFGVDSTTLNASRQISLAELKNASAVRVFANVAAMVADTSVKDGSVAITRGYSTAGVGANRYRFVLGDATTADGVLVITHASPSGRWHSEVKSFVDIATAGVTGDGITDDSTAMISAITAAVNAGVPVVGSDMSVKLTAWTASGHLLNSSNKLTMRFSNVTFTGDGASVATEVFIRTTTGCHVDIEGGSFSAWNKVFHADSTTGSDWTCRIANCSFSACDSPIHCDQTNTRFFYNTDIFGNVITGSTTYGIFWGDNNGKVRIANNRVTDTASTAASCAGILVGTDNTTSIVGLGTEVCGNTVNNVSTTNAAPTRCVGIWALGANVSIHDNHIENVLSSASTLKGDGIYAQAANQRVSRNTVVNCSGLSSLPTGGMITVNKTTLDGYSIVSENNCLATADNNPYAGIIAVQTPGVVICGNSVTCSGSGTLQSAIQFRLSNKGICKNNIIEDIFTRTNTVSRGVYAQGMTDGVIEGNVIKNMKAGGSGDFATDAIQVDSTTDRILIHGNKISGSTTPTNGYAVAINLSGLSGGTIDLCSIKDNEIEGYDVGCLTQSHNAGPSKNITNLVFENNVVDQRNVPAARDYGCIGFWGDQGIDKCRIVGNKIIGSASVVATLRYNNIGIFLKHTQAGAYNNCEVSRNSIIDVVSATSGTQVSAGIRIEITYPTATMDGFECVDNVIDGCTRGIYQNSWQSYSNSRVQRNSIVSSLVGAIGINISTAGISEAVPTWPIDISNNTFNGTSGASAANIDPHTLGNSAGGTVNLDWRYRRRMKQTLAASTIYTFTAPPTDTSFEIVVVQDATGGRIVTWPSIQWIGGLPKNANDAPNAVSVFRFWYNGSSYFEILANSG